MKSITIKDIFALAVRSVNFIQEDWMRMFGDNDFVDTTFLVRLPEGRVAKLTLAHTNRTYIHEPDAIRVDIISKTLGKLDGQLFAFKDYFVSKSDKQVSPAGYALKKYFKGEGELFDQIDPTNTSVEDLITAMATYIDAYV